ncbi:L-aspartate oxidase [Roseimicrobium gellanilyticum]|uniref:L-aspartate oxidase n=1 Tax=Roseimicrobium gellanilyticum TaxID=748857 RepID=A0A366HE82_9BACT|nr:L-aspartate oxidase [Roseimicrobium gellanilyticum]RBP39618.1 L-aspartate oxidase [Roseimicrobium gellanilyticum]
MHEYDFIVVGSGAAGLTAALRAAKHGKVAVVTKKSAEDSNSAWAQGGVACVQSEEDSIDQHVQDTLIAGAGLCKEDVVRTIASEGPARMAELIALGVQFDRREVNGTLEFDLTREGGHTRRRVLHHHDATGKEISDKLVAAAKAEPNITLLENHYAIDLITTAKLGFVSEDRVIGVYVLNETSGDVVAMRSDRIILATGGCGRVYQYTTNPRVATGDGVAIAWRAGAQVANMEFIQFHPTCLYHPQKRSFLITEAMRGEGAVLVGKDGKEFMHRYDPRGSLAPRDIVARAIDHEIKRTGGPCVYLDITSKPADFIIAHFPNIHKACLDVGIDITKEPIPVVPAAHYQCGGVRTDVNGATSLRGLCAVGEVGCTGLHGANRLASNSLLECFVLGHRAVDFLLHKLPMGREELQEYEIPAWQSGDAQSIDELVVIYHNWDEIRRLMWDYVSIVRTSKRLQRAAARLRNLKREVQEFYWHYRVTAEVLELRNLVECASLIVDCAVRRHESRGLHYTLDYPNVDATKPPQDTVLRRY